MLSFLMHAQTVVPPGPVEGNWDAGGSPYQITGDISIADGSALEIGPGVDVVFQDTYKLDVLGTLNANGTAGSPVTFTAQDTLNGWSSIRFSDNAAGFNQPSSFTHTNFLYGKAIWGSSGQDPLNYGGAVWADNAGILTFTDCVFSRCKATYDGGAIYANNNTTVVMSGCSVKNCDTAFFGGVFVEAGTAQITGCAFDANVSGAFASCLYVYECGLIEVTSCSFTDNSAAAIGAIYSYDSTLEIRNSLFSGNATTTGLGGGLGIIDSSLSIINCTFYANYSPQGGAAAWFNILPQPAQITNCVFWENDPEALYATSSTYNLAYCSMQSQEGDATNIFGDPLFTDPLEGDLTLSGSSPCIDAGTPDTQDLDLPDDDLCGLPRIVDGDGDSLARIDIGCYEWQPPDPYGVISGYVRTSQNQPIEDATITVLDSTAHSDATGLYELELAPGTYDVTCSRTGYVTYTETGVVVEPGQTTTLDFYLDIVDVSDDIMAPNAASLEIHPNPFGNSALIAYQISKGADTTLAVYNLRGQKIKTLSSGFAMAGENHSHWDGKDENGTPVESGLYLLKLRCGSQTITRKLIKF
ncbi:MAG: carboxypeptidase regulatory-like domain-containing protein [Candidatus Syntrophosphaera sp.]